MGLEGVRYGSDAVVEALARWGVRHVSLNPGATIRGLHESITHFSASGGPAPVLCCHEEIAVGLAHGYTKTSGELMAVALHNVVGLAHASMAIFNAWCDRVPIVLLGGTGPMRQSERRPWIDWIHTAYLQGGLVRDFVKWETQVFGVESMASAVSRACKTATATPYGPVYVCFDVEDQEALLPETHAASTPAEQAATTVHPDDLDRVGRWLRDAESPVVVADFYNALSDPAAPARLAALSERWAVPVVDLGARHNMPNGHRNCLTDAKDALLSDADLVLALDVRDLYGTLRPEEVARGRGPRRRQLPAGCRVVSVGEEGIPRGSWVPDYSAAEHVDVEIGVPSARFVADLLDSEQAVGDRETILERQRHLDDVRTGLLRAWEQETARVWDADPISTARLCGDLGDALAGSSWVLTNCRFMPWPRRTWDMDGRRNTHIGRSGGEGLGYALSASLGSALACKESGRIAVDIQGDGDFLYVPGALWTAAAYALPLLVVVHNNFGYHQDRLHQQTISEGRRRGSPREGEGIEFTGPEVGFGDIARGLGIWAEQPVRDAASLRPALQRAVAHVERTGTPALVDVAAAPR